MVRYIAKFSKARGIKFISHLDLMRCVERAFRRAEIPVSYSKGFNPHTDLSFATPLSVGVSSSAEYMEFKLDSEMQEADILNNLNKSLSHDIFLMEVKRVNEQIPSLMSMIDAAMYEINLINIGESKLTKDEIIEFMNKPDIEVIKSGKKGDRVVNIKPMIYFMDIKQEDDKTVIITATLAAGSKENLNPELLIQGMRTYINGLDKMEVRDIAKKETYIIRDNKFLSPMGIIENREW